jgi:hypothetical protein
VSPGRNTRAFFVYKYMSIGYVCEPRDSITLILSKFWTPIGVTTAQDSVRKLVRESGKKRGDQSMFVLDKHCNIKNWSQWVESSHDELYDNQPYMRSKHHRFPVPTIILTTAKWTYNCKRKPTLRYMYKRYRGVCQICGEHKPLADMSVEHIFPKSLHGTNDDYNLTLTCKPCNHTRGNIFPFFSESGEPLEPLPQLPFLHVFGSYREEWKTYFVAKLD